MTQVATISPFCIITEASFEVSAWTEHSLCTHALLTIVTAIHSETKILHMVIYQQDYSQQDLSASMAYRCGHCHPRPHQGRGKNQMFSILTNLPHSPQFHLHESGKGKEEVQHKINRNKNNKVLYSTNTGDSFT